MTKRPVRLIILALAVSPVLAAAQLARAAEPTDDLFKQGSALLDKGQYDEAIAAFTKAIQANDKDFAALGGRGLAYINKSEWQKAIADFDAAITIDPKQPFTHFNRGFAWFRLNNFDKAIADYDEAIRLDPKYEDAYRDRGFARTMSGKPREGLPDLNKAVELNPKDAAAYNSRGAAFSKLAEWDYGHRRLRTVAQTRSQGRRYLDRLRPRPHDERRP